MSRSLVARSLVARTLVARGVVDDDRPPAPTSGAPVLSNIAASSITQTTALITWDIDQPATGQVNYGTTAGYGSSTTQETSFDYSSHAQGITGLTAGTLYHYRVRSTNVNSQETVSGDNTFTTLDSPPTEDEAGVRPTTPTLTPSGGTTTCGGSARTNVSIGDLDYPTTDEGEAVSWRPTGGHLHEIADGTSESAAKAIITAATSGTVSNPCIIQFASGSTFNWTTRYVFQAPRQYVILWGYGATVHSTGTATRTHFQYDGTTGSPLNHHMKVLGFTLTGTHTDAGTTGAYGIDNAICIALYGQCEDFEIADVDIHNVWSDGIYLNGDSQSWVRCERISIHHSLIDKCGRMNVTLNQCEDLWFIWNVVSNSAMYLIDVEDARHENQDQVNYYIRDNVFDSWCWDKEAFGASYFNQNAVAFVNNRATGSYTNVASNMSASYIYFERNQFFGGPRGWGSTASVVYQGETGIDNKFNEAVCFGPASWSQSAGSNGTIPKTNVYIRDNDFGGVPSGVRGRGSITLTWCTTGEITGNNCPGYDIFSISNTSVTISGNTADAVKTAWP